jgi:Creatinase/Prolidase N-terminal domain
MRRGLMKWDENELPRAVLLDRQSRLRAAMERERLEAFLIYTNLVRPSAVCWLTGFTPYWIDSLLLLPQAGPPILATALSKRVADWVRSSSSIEEIINTPRPGTAIGQKLAMARCKRVGLLELDALPRGHYEDLTAAAPAAELVDATASFAAVRSCIDDTERRLIERADQIAIAALADVDPNEAKDAGLLAGQVEKHARLAAAEEAHIAVAPDLDADRRLIGARHGMRLGQRFAVRVSVAYKGNWVRRTRTFARDGKAARAIASADAWLAQVLSQHPASQPLGTFLTAALAAAELRGIGYPELKRWMAETCKGSYPLELVASSSSDARYSPAAGTLLLLSIELAVDDVPWLAAAPMFVSG